MSAMSAMSDNDAYLPSCTLRAGALSVCLEDNGLKNICYDGHEIVRAVYFAMRDESWQTYSVQAHSHYVNPSDGAFQVDIDGTAGPKGHELAVSISIGAASDGLLTFQVTTSVLETVRTNRTGIVVLHPLAVSGKRVTVTTSEGGRIEGAFPVLIDPYQPFKSFNGLLHEVAGAVSVDITLTGDVFEMEDQRNWSDASYKTYSRPIGLPWPYTLEKGDVFSQTFHLSARKIDQLDTGSRHDDNKDLACIRFSDARHGGGGDGDIGSKFASAGGDIGGKVGGDTGSVIDTIDGAGATMPLLGLFLDTPAPDQQAQCIAALALLKPGYLVCRGTADDPRLDSQFSWLGRVATSVPNAPRVVLELVLPCADTPRRELARVQASMQRAGFSPEAIIVTPAVDLKGVLPGSAWPACPPLQEIYDAARQIFDTALIGGGTLAFFTELNRKRPDTALLDFVGFTTCPIVHAADDVSVMQTLTCLPHIARSVTALFAPVPFWVGPSSIAARMNPYGAETPSNPLRAKIALTHDDVRQFTPFSAAWALGYIAAFAKHGAQRIALSEWQGPRGITMRDGGYHDDAGNDGHHGADGNDDKPRLSPLGALLAALYPFAHCPLLDVDIEVDMGVDIDVEGHPDSQFAALGLVDGSSRHVWIANLGPDPRSCTIALGSQTLGVVEIAGYDVMHTVLEAL